AREEAQITEKLWESYELTVGTAEKYFVEIESFSDATKRIGELKSEVRRLGTVDVNSIEEYEKVSERYEFMSKQCADLEAAKAELLKMISEITEEMQKIFSEQFKVINKNFGETFTEIFGGGHAELVLEDTGDILNCGIEIKVQPPGKTLKTITLLSGGERAFVAIALYFAIMKVRPTPFCVLDEIEAALDDVNVSRYAEYLRRLAKTTQFIVITHRRGTMEEADMLYGVTMQEKGVSKMLAISISEVEKSLGVKLS
ncbi:MAG: chromosome segregation protein SMC, partial [Oscillospiraceae bacterium]|nr:chromosome segregation protein SMC [Oscillospiraceae bacterium]